MAKPWSVEDLRQLITSYFTDPEFAEVGHIGSDKLHIALDGGELFEVTIERLSAKVLAVSNG